MIDRLSADFNRGYRKAIIDIMDVFVYAERDLEDHRKRMNYKLAIELLTCCLDNRERLRESYTGFVRWNGKRFEWREPEPMKGTVHWRKTC